MINMRMLAMLAAAFASGSFFASPLPEAIASTIANDVICNGCVGTSDLAGNAVTAAKIKDGEVKAAEIAANSVGASELVGVTKLLFGECSTSEAVGVQFNPHIGTTIDCNISGADTDDSVLVTLNGIQNPCFDAANAYVFSSGVVNIIIRNGCSFSTTFQSGSPVSVIVFDN